MDSKSVQELIELKANYIKECDFVSARETKEAINKKKKSDAQTKLDSICSTILEHIQANEDKRRLILEVCESEYNAQISEYRLKVDSLFRNFQARHITELIKIEENYTNQILKEKSRSIPQYNQLIKQAQGLAKADDFEGAIRIQEQAEKIKAKDFNQRRALIDEKFIGLKETVYERQKCELLSLNQKLSSYFSYCKKKYDENVEQINEKFKVFLLREEKTAIFDATKSVIDKNSKIEMAEKINLYMTEKIKELYGEEFQLPLRKTRPKTPTKKSSRTSTNAPEENDENFPDLSSSFVSC